MSLCLISYIKWTDRFRSLDTSHIAVKEQDQFEFSDINSAQQPLPHFSAPIIKLNLDTTKPIRSQHHASIAR